MAITYYIGSIPTYPEELRQKASQLSDFINNKRAPFLEFRNGTIDRQEFQTLNSQANNAFSDIGLGKPLSIEIITSYAGDVPKKILGRRPEVMTVSGVKSHLDYAASARMINHIQARVQDYSYLEIGAFEKGSPIVYYSPALHSGTIFCSFELVADTFGKSFSKTLSRLFAHAGTLPIFAPAAPFLLAGSAASRYTGKALHKIFESKAYLSDDITLRFDTPEIPMSIARQWLVCNQQDQKALMEYKPGLVDGPDGRQHTRLIHRKTGEIYKGKAPYIIASIDGRDRPELESFKSKVASASILERFYGSSNKMNVSLAMLEESLSLYNDFYYMKKIQKLKKSIRVMKKESDQDSEAELLLEAYIKNIQKKEILNI